jgi:hypothetical protein
MLGVKALAFDVFGTVVDWRGSIIREGTEWAEKNGLIKVRRPLPGYGAAMDIRHVLAKLRAHRMILNDVDVPRSGLE